MRLTNSIIKSGIIAFCIFLSVQTKAQMNEGQLITDVRELDLNTIAYDPAHPKAGKGNTLTYADIEGTPFWNEQWAPAIIYFANGSKAKINQAKLNLYTDEIHYLSSDDAELAVDNDGVTRLVFLNKNNLTQPIASFAKLNNHVNGKGTAFYRVLNAGNYQLILLQKQLIKTSPYDPIQAKRISSFYSTKDYAMYNNGKVTSLKDIDRTSILSSIPFNANVEAWLKENKNKLKTEKEAISFLNYFNSL
jgi:tellurite resistance-related uncharacterized protein